MAALVRNYTIERGIQFSRLITITDGGSKVDLTGVTLAGQLRVSQFPTDIRAYPTGTGPVAVTLDLDLAEDPTTGKLTFGLSDTKSAALERGLYDFDVILTFPSQDKQRIIYGIITIVQTTSL
jgi:hypothetical protein